jgi:hypothetical protein
MPGYFRSSSSHRWLCPCPSYKTTLWLANPGALAISLTLTTTTNDRPSYQTLELGPFESAGIPVSSDTLLVQSAK